MKNRKHYATFSTEVTAVVKLHHLMKIIKFILLCGRTKKITRYLQFALSITERTMNQNCHYIDIL